MTEEHHDYMLRLRSLPGVTPDQSIRIRHVLKRLLREFGFKCTHIWESRLDAIKSPMLAQAAEMAEKMTEGSPEAF